MQERRNSSALALELRLSGTIPSTLYKKCMGDHFSEISCDPPYVPEHGSVRVRRSETGSQAIFTCEGGFVLVGEMILECTQSGFWDNIEPTCEGKQNIMRTSSNGNIFRVTGLWCGEFTGHRWIPLTKASKAELWCFLWSAPEHTAEQIWRLRWFEAPSRSLWCHYNDYGSILLREIS